MAVSVELELIDDAGTADRYCALLRAVVQRALETEGLDGSYLMTISLVSDEQIQEINRTHRGIDAVTDVLSFPLLGDDAAEFVLPPGASTHLGDIAISVAQCERQAQEYGHSAEREMGYLAAHGVLHLLGYDHEDEEDRLQMRTREEEILVELPR